MKTKVRIENKKANEFMLVHKCEKCGFEKRNRLEENDNFEVIKEVAKKSL
jgi:RNase P subunit RPR2